MTAILTSNCASRFVHGNEIPPKFLHDDDCLVNRVNPPYLKWEEHDQAIFSESLQPRVSDRLNQRDRPTSFETCVFLTLVSEHKFWCPGNQASFQAANF
ncbi:hypothetical protein Lal_00013745 [Lupinus albus]|nr:hypothetical protein Lal_00013745 [Lupinus albus]